MYKPPMAALSIPICLSYSLPLLDYRQFVSWARSYTSFSGCLASKLEEAHDLYFCSKLIIIFVVSPVSYKDT